MSSADCTDTIARGAHRQPTLAVAIALAWFVARLFAHWCNRGVDRALLWAERAHQRRQLAELDDYMLRDVGLTRSDVTREIRKPFWQQ